MEHAVLNKTSESVSIAPLDQGAITLLWDEISACIRESVGDDPITESNALGALRAREMIAWAVRDSGKVVGILITRPVENGYSGGSAMLIYGVRGTLDLDGWRVASGQFEAACRGAGVRKITAFLQNDRSERLAHALGWQTKMMAWKELDNG